MAEMTFTLNHAAIQAMAVGEEMQAAVLSVAEKAKGIAEGLSTDFMISGEYESSFEAYMEILGLPPLGASLAHAAACGVLWNFAPYAVAVEYGYDGRSNAPTGKAHRVFGRTLAALGGS